MPEILSRKEVFKNDYGSISLEKVCISRIKKIFNVKEIAYIEIKINQSFIVYKRFYLRVMFTNNTYVDFLIKKIEINKALKFVRAFSNFKSFNSDIT